MYPTASRAAILAIGNPVALDASADERDTRGFISMTTRRPVVRVHGELDVAAAGVDADRAQHRDADVAHVLVLAVGEGHGGRDGDRVAGVHAHRVEVLDGADDDHVVVAVAHQLQLELLPPEHRLLDEHLGDRRRGEPGAREPVEVGVGVRHAGAEPAHRERRPDHHREAEVGRGGAHLVHGVADGAARHVAADATGRSP